MNQIEIEVGELNISNQIECYKRITTVMPSLDLQLLEAFGCRGSVPSLLLCDLLV